MPFRCPHCFSPTTFVVTHSVELPSDNRSDEILLQSIRCSACGFRALAVYEESRRGALDDEAWDHTGYAVEGVDLDKMVKLMKTCPDPKNPRCVCSAHQTLGKKDPSGRWNGLEEVDILFSFRMEMA